MKRVQLFEFEDFNWFPSFMRISMTKLIVVLHDVTKMHLVLGSLVKKAIEKTNAGQIVDLGSGAGGAMPKVKQLLNEDTSFDSVHILLSDLYPDEKAIDHVRSMKINGLDYHKESVNATELDKAPNGLKTMVNSFHHMPKDMARKILRSAYESKEPILIYEMAENKMPLLLWWLFLPLGLTILFIMCLFMTPFVKPLTLEQVIFTYIIPIIPLTYAWDGQASYPRMYAYNDYKELLVGLEDDSYSWEVGPAINTKGKSQGHYVLGTPTIK